MKYYKGCWGAGVGGFTAILGFGFNTVSTLLLCKILRKRGSLDFCMMSQPTPIPRGKEVCDALIWLFVRKTSDPSCHRGNLDFLNVGWSVLGKRKWKSNWLLKINEYIIKKLIKAVNFIKYIFKNEFKKRRIKKLEPTKAYTLSCLA